MFLDVIPKWRSKHACIVDATVAYDELKMDKLFILLVHHVIKMKSLDHHLLCLIQCCMNVIIKNTFIFVGHLKIAQLTLV